MNLLLRFLLPPVVLAFASFGAQAEPLPTTGCPVFHCSPESLGVMYEPLAGPLTSVQGVRTLGGIRAQGCSGDGRWLACLFAPDGVTEGATIGP